MKKDLYCYKMTIFLYGYIHSKIHKFLNYFFAIILIIPCKIVAKRSRTPKSVVLVANHVGARICKIGYGLKSAGWHVVLLHSEDFESDPSLSFHETHRYSTPYKALLLAIKYTPVVYHIFSSWNFDVAYLFVKYKPGKIVFDDYDVMAGMVKKEFAEKNYPGQVDKERFCLENSDGLCCRSHELKYVKNQMSYKLSDKTIFFPDYCWDFPAATPPKAEYPNDEIHIVFCGNLPFALAEDDSESYQIWLAKLLAKQQIHYHIYPLHFFTNNPENYQGYTELDKNTPFFHFHRHFDPITLIEEMREYDFGIHITSKHIDLQEHDAYIKEKADFAMSNKIFDYIDAGLFVIIYNAELQKTLLKQYKIAIDATLILHNDIKHRLKEIKRRNDMKTNVNRAKFAYSIREEIYRLITFYNNRIY